MAVSILLFLAQVSGIDVRKINVFGNEIGLSNPDVVYYFLWVLFLYWLVRYYQHFRSTKDKGFKTAFYSELDVLLKKVAYKKMLKDSVKMEKYSKEQRKDLSFYNSGGVKHRSLKEYSMILEFPLLRDSSRNLPTETVVLDFREVLIPRLRSAYHVLVSTPLVTEYYLPFFVALVPIAYSVYEWFV